MAKPKPKQKQYSGTGVILLRSVRSKPNLTIWVGWKAYLGLPNRPVLAWRPAWPNDPEGLAGLRPTASCCWSRGCWGAAGCGRGCGGALSVLARIRSPRRLRPRILSTATTLLQIQGPGQTSLIIHVLLYQVCSNWSRSGCVFKLTDALTEISPRLGGFWLHEEAGNLTCGRVVL